MSTPNTTTEKPKREKLSQRIVKFLARGGTITVEKPPSRQDIHRTHAKQNRLDWMRKIGRR